ncbi:MAG TPA: PIN domain-containing protein, partial [Vampirovibrionales bacterium]
MYILDTNVIIEDPHILNSYKEDIYLCSGVLGELDNQKTGASEKSRNIREFFRELDENPER